MIFIRRINVNIILKTLLLVFVFGQFLFINVSVCQAQAGTAAPTELENPLGGERGLGEAGIITVVASVIKQFLGIIGSITLLVFMYGGFLWLTSAGKQDQVAKGSKTMLYAVIGIAVIFSSYVILSAIITGLTRA